MLFRRLVAVLLGFMVIAGAGLGTLGFASAAGNAKAILYPEQQINWVNQDEGFCQVGGAPSGQTNGFINVHRDGNTLLVNFHLRDAAPDASYQINQSCVRGDIARLTTNANGVGDVTFSEQISSGETQFVFDVCLMPCGTQPTITYYASGLVTLP